MQSDHRRHLRKDAVNLPSETLKLLQQVVEEVFQDIDIDSEFLFRKEEHRQYKKTQKAGI